MAQVADNMASHNSPLSTSSPISDESPRVDHTCDVPPIYGYHYVSSEDTSARLYIVTRGLDIGIFRGWENVSPLVTGVSRSTYCRVKSIEEGHYRMQAAANDGSLFRVSL